MINRTIAPPVVIPDDLNILHFKTLITNNNISLHYINSGTQDVIRVSVVFKAGVKYQSKNFLSSSVINMLTEGTANYSAELFAEKVDFYGIYFDQTIDRDFSIVTMCCLKRFLNEGLEMLCEALTTPSFTQKEFDIYRNKRKQSILIDREKVNVIARELFVKTLFGSEHPYGSVGEVDDFDKISIEDLQSFFNDYYSAENCFSVVSGKITEDDLTNITSLLEKLNSSTLPSYTSREIITESEAHIIKEDALQSSIRIGKILFNREHPDFTPMQVLTTVLGGYFGSRLVKNLREDKGYTYSISAMMINLEESGYFAATTEVAVEYTQDSIDQIFYEIERLTNELIPSDELEMVKNVMIGEILRVLDGPFGINDVAIENIQNKTDNTYLLEMINKVKSITSEELLLLAQKYFKKGSFTTVYVGKI